MRFFERWLESKARKKWLQTRPPPDETPWLNPKYLAYCAKEERRDGEGVPRALQEQRRFDREHRSCGVPLIIQGALQMGPHWELQEFVSLFEAEAAYQVRIHGGDSFATTPDMWRNKKSHARHVVWTSPQKFADTIATGIAARYARCAIQTRAVHPAHGPFSCP